MTARGNLADLNSAWDNSFKMANSTNANQKIWFITGCSSGLGAALARFVLQNGCKTVATARNPVACEELQTEFPDLALVERLDVTDLGSIEAAVKATIKRWGRIDVLVNNAGYCLRGAVEECSPQEIRKEFETNVFGPVQVIQGILPYMRAQHEGLIINISSIVAHDSPDGSAFYGASKSALEGISTGLAKEVGPLGIKVMLVEPGPFRTDFFNRSLDITQNEIADYAPLLEERKKRLDKQAMNSSHFSEPGKAAAVIFKAANEPAPPEFLLLGSNALTRADAALKHRLDQLEKWRSLSEQTD